MRAHIRKMGPRTWLASGFALWVMAVGSALGSAAPQPLGPPPAQNQKPAAVATKAVPGAGAEGQSYVGEAKCLECHSEQLKGYEGSPHHRVADPRSPAAKQGCESCHGPGSKHVDDPGRVSCQEPEQTPAGGSECHVHHLPQPRRARIVGRQPARRAEAVVYDVPQRAQLQVGDQTAEGEDAGGRLRLVSPRQDRQAGSLGPHAGARGQARVHHLPQRARRDQRAAAAKGRFHRRAVHVVPRREARPVPLGARAQPRWLRDVPRPARLVERAHARRQASDPLSAVPCRDAPSEHHLRRGAHRVRRRTRASGSMARSCVTCHSAIHGSNHPSGQRFIR